MLLRGVLGVKTIAHMKNSIGHEMNLAFYVGAWGSAFCRFLTNDRLYSRTIHIHM